MAVDPVIIRFALQGVSDVTRAFTLIEERMAKAEVAGVESAKKGAAARKTVAERESADKEREYRKVVASVEKGQREETRSAETEARRRDMIVRRSSEMAGRYAEQQASEEIRAAQRATKALEREHEKRAAMMRATGRQIGSAVARGVGGVGHMAATALTVGGGFLVADTIREDMTAGRTAAQLVNIVTTGKKPPAGATVANILGQAGQVAQETGISKGEVTGAALMYAQHAKGGDFKGAMANMGFFAKMHQVTGADMNELASSAGTLQSQNPSLDSKGMQQMLLNTYAQSQQGSMSMSDVAKQMGTMGAMRSAFTGNTAVTQGKLMGIGQFLAPGGDVAEAGTFTKDFAEMALKKQDKLKALGVKYDKSGRVDMPMEDMIGQVMKGTGGDMGKILKIFEGRGGKVFEQAEEKFQAAGGGEKGKQAVIDSIKQITGATGTTEDFDAKWTEAMSQPIEKLSVAMEKLKAAVSAELTPWIDRLADKLPEIVEQGGVLVGALASFAALIADNPVPAALALFAVKMGGSAGMIAEAFIAGIAAIDWAAAADRATQRKNVAQDVGGLNEAGQLRAKAEAGTLTPADIKHAQETEAQLRGQADKLGKGATAQQGGILNPLGYAVDAVTAERHAQDARASKLASESADMLDKALKRASASANAFAASLPKDPARHAPIDVRPP